MIYKLKINSLEIKGAFFYDKDFGFYFFCENELEINLPEVSFDIDGEYITLKNKSVNEFLVYKINKYNKCHYAFALKNGMDLLNVDYLTFDKLDINSNFELFNGGDVLLFLASIKNLPNGNYIVGSVEDYISTICEMNDKYKNLEHFYRGHYHYKYQLVPSLFRKAKFFNNESDIYMDFKTQYYNELSHKKYIEILTTMQHYKMPTRLLDTTSNPLVALFMACDKPINYTNKKVNVGEVIYMSCDRKDIKYSDSNTTTLLSSLACLETKYKKELYYLIKKAKEENNPDIYLNSISYKRFVAEVKTELVSFDEKIFDPGVLLHHFHVKVGMINDRIIAQSGNFVLFGLFDYDKSEIFPLETKSKERIFIVHRDFIMKELEMLNIDNGTMYPDKDHMSYEIVKKYK
jgi:hypothetical protein